MKTWKTLFLLLTGLMLFSSDALSQKEAAKKRSAKD